MLNQLKTIILLGALTGLILIIGQVIGGSSGLIIALMFSIILNFVTYFFSDKIVLALYGAKEANIRQYRELHQMVADVAKRAGVPKPKVYIVQSSTPNAFATGRSPKHAVIACTTGILDLLTQKELRGVIAHEMSHVKNRDILITTIAATLAGIISTIASLARFGLITGSDRDRGNLLEILFIALVTPLMAMLLQLALSRSREYLADETGAHLISDPDSLADALQKLEQGNRRHPLQHGNPATSGLFIINPFNARGLVNLLSTHPPLGERIARLRRMKF